jgi:hypothetical protein
MILSRLTRAIREQNWFAVVLEFVIVVSGVFLAFQVSTWSAQADQRAYVRDVLGRLHGELSAVAEVRARLLEPRADRLAHLLEARPVIMQAGGPDILSDADCFSIAVSHYGIGNSPDAFPSLDELVSSGAVEAIRSEALRHAAMQLHSKRTAVRTRSSTDAGRIVNLPQMYPDAVQATLFADPQDEEDGYSRGAACDLAAMRSDTSFQAALIENTEILWTHVDFTYGFLDDAIESLRLAIEAELDLPQSSAPRDESAP